MVTLKKYEEYFIICWDQHLIGTAQPYRNPYHMRNCYLKFNLSYYPIEISRELFSQIEQEVRCPLQVMLSSDETEQIAFLQAGGFSCKRKCYEAEGTFADLIIKESNCRLLQCTKESERYAQCCKLMYDAYVQNHAAINPWTADFESFCEKLPECVLYSAQNEAIIALAFVENNEIAYLCAREPLRFRAFASALAARMLEEYETVCFECDDCDWAAMTLRSMFKNQSKKSYNTYIYPS